MLVLKRKAEEEIRIGPDVTVKVLGVGWGTVRLGITAPSDTQIVRPEAKVQEPRLRRERGRAGGGERGRRKRHPSPVPNP